jgi:hypothetical protein
MAEECCLIFTETWMEHKKLCSTTPACWGGLACALSCTGA